MCAWAETKLNGIKLCLFHIFFSYFIHIIIPIDGISFFNKDVYFVGFIEIGIRIKIFQKLLLPKWWHIMTEVLFIIRNPTDTLYTYIYIYIYI